MRDPNRIPTVLFEIKQLWEKHPDLRLGQLILNAGTENRIYMMEDDVLLTELRRVYDKDNYYGIKDV